MIPGRQCEHCNNNYQFIPTNTLIIWYEFQPWISFAQSACPHCNTVGKTFFRDSYAECMEYFITSEFQFVNAEFPARSILDMFEETYGVSMVQVVQLTPRLEDEVERLRIVLEAIPDDLLLDILETPATSNLPELWHDA